jgi:hypothetical protein
MVIDLDARCCSMVVPHHSLEDPSFNVDFRMQDRLESFSPKSVWWRLSMQALPFSNTNIKDVIILYSII